MLPIFFHYKWNGAWLLVIKNGKLFYELQNDLRLTIIEN